MNSIRNHNKDYKASHHRPFLGPDGTVRINHSAGGWRLASRAEAVLVAPNTRRLQRFREDDR